MRILCVDDEPLAHQVFALTFEQAGWEAATVSSVRAALAFLKGDPVDVVASDFNQLFGRYHGWLRTGEDEKIPVEGILGYMERHYAKW